MSEDYVLLVSIHVQANPSMSSDIMYSLHIPYFFLSILVLDDHKQTRRLIVWWPNGISGWNVANGYMRTFLRIIHA